MEELREDVGVKGVGSTRRADTFRVEGRWRRGDRDGDGRTGFLVGVGGECRMRARDKVWGEGEG